MRGKTSTSFRKIYPLELELIHFIIHYSFILFCSQIKPENIFGNFHKIQKKSQETP